MEESRRFGSIWQWNIFYFYLQSSQTRYTSLQSLQSLREGRLRVFYVWVSSRDPPPHPPTHSDSDVWLSAGLSWGAATVKLEKHPDMNRYAHTHTYSIYYTHVHTHPNTHIPTPLATTTTPPCHPSDRCPEACLSDPQCWADSGLNAGLPGCKHKFHTH